MEEREAFGVLEKVFKTFRKTNNAVQFTEFENASYTFVRFLLMNIEYAHRYSPD